jgi:acyl-CoA synthetase (AMP-forming)/AMP-acid ligase II
MKRTALSQALHQAFEEGAQRALKLYDFEGEAACLSFAELGQQVEGTAQRLAGAGVGPGVVVALMGPTSVELCRTAAALWMLGAAVTVLPTPSRLGSLESFLMETLAKLEGSQASLLVGEPSMVEAFAEMLSIPALSWEALQAGQACQVVLKAGVPSALVQFSSGTTREPQPILLSQEALLANARAVLARFPGGADQHSCVSWLPLYHDMGLIGCFLMPLLAPGDLTLMGPEVFAARPVTWLEAISRERATTSSAPNFALAYCADRISEDQLEGLDLSCWTIAMVGAEPVRPQTLRRFAERFAAAGFDARAFSPVYGLAEATLAVTFSPLGEGLKTLSLDSQTLATSGRVVAGSRESVSLGTPIDGVQVSVRDEQGELGEDRLGEVYVKGPSLFSGYLGQDSSQRLTAGGWLRTGDMGFLHDGQLHLYGRRRDILLLDGRNHDPSLLEGAVEVLEPLRRCCAFMREAAEGDRDLLVLACEVAHSFAGDPLELRREIFAKGRAASGLTPAQLVLVKAGSLPSTSSGKLRRGETARLYTAGGLELWEPTASLAR